MNCSNCQNPIQQGEKFCGSCGSPVDVNSLPNIQPFLQQELTQDTQGSGERKHSLANFIVSLIFILGIPVARSLVDVYGGPSAKEKKVEIVLVSVVFLLIFFIGWGLASWYGKKRSVTSLWIKFIAWSNIFSGLLVPFVGVLTGAFILRCSSLAGKDKIKYNVLGYIGVGFGILNSFLGIIFREWMNKL